MAQMSREKSSKTIKTNLQRHSLWLIPLVWSVLHIPASYFQSPDLTYIVEKNGKIDLSPLHSTFDLLNITSFEMTLVPL